MGDGAEVPVQRLPLKLRLALLATLLALGSQSVSWAVDGQRSHTVRSGETLSGISAAEGVPLADLISLNQLGNPDRIAAGQLLLLPGAAAGSDARQEQPSQSSAPATPGRVEYVVKQGDTLSRIASERNTTISAIVRLNDLTDPDRLKLGQRIFVPTDTSATPPSSGSAATPPAAPGAPPGPAPSTSAGALLETAAGHQNVDASLVKAVAWYLSAWQQDARSPSGSVGLMQVSEATQEWVAERLLKRAADRENPVDNAEIGAAYLAYLVNRFGDERQGVGAYLQGPGSVTRSGLTPATERSLNTIWSARARFAAGGATFQASTNQPAGADTVAATPPANLQAAVVAAFKQVAGDARLGVTARNLSTGERLSIRGDEVFHSASVNKVPIAAEVLREAQAGTVAMNDTVRQDLERALVLSDNDAANRLLNLAGEPKVNALMASLGLTSIRMNNFFSLASGPVDPGFNQTSPVDMATLFVLMANDKLVSPSVSQTMRGLLQRTADGTKLARGLPPGTPLAHKSGWYSGVANDVGIVYASRATYVLAVFTEGVDDPETANQAIATVSRTVFDAWRK
jgi:beta-lactamase class A/LysM repeat protein